MIQIASRRRKTLTEEINHHPWKACSKKATRKCTKSTIRTPLTVGSVRAGTGKSAIAVGSVLNYMQEQHQHAPHKKNPHRAPMSPCIHAAIQPCSPLCPPVHADLVQKGPASPTQDPGVHKTQKQDQDLCSHLIISLSLRSSVEILWTPGQPRLQPRLAGHAMEGDVLVQHALKLILHLPEQATASTKLISKEATETTGKQCGDDKEMSGRNRTSESDCKIMTTPRAGRHPTGWLGLI